MHAHTLTSRTLGLLMHASLLIFAAACSQPADDTQEDMSPALMQDMAMDLSAMVDAGDTTDMSEAQDLTAMEDLRDEAPDLLDPQDLSSPDADMHLQDMQDDMHDASSDMPDMPDMLDDMSPEEMGTPGQPLPGFGAITGDCQMIDTELASPSPSLFRNELDFMMDPYDMSDLMQLTPGGQALLAAGNINANSLLSEVFAFEVLARCEGAVFLEGENGVDYYDEMGKRTDILVEIDGERVGVSVVRAFVFPFEDPYPEDEARRILNKKLGDILLSTQNVKPVHAWNKQILSVIAYTPQHADQIEAVYQTLDPMVKSDTILYITATQGEDRPLYFND